MNKNTVKKIAAAVLVMTMSVGFIAAAPASESGPADDLITGDMMVYVMSDPSGKPEKLILTEDVAEALPDSKKTRGLLMVDTDGNKLKKENIGDELPVEMEISYTLDGKKISPKKLAGKSGHVTIRYDYKNLCKTKAVINGAETEINVPFGVITGLVLDDEHFSNIEVTSGKAVSDGTRTVVAGVSLPGLQDNLGLSRELIDLPEYVEISADVEDFRLDMSLTLVTNDIFGSKKDKNIDLSDLQNAVKRLREAMDMLLDGAGQLYDGICLMYDKSGMLVDGVTQLHDGMNLLNSHSGELNDGATLVFTTLLDMAVQQIREKGLEIEDLTIDNYKDVLTRLIDSLSPEAMLETIKDQIVAKLEPTRPEFHKSAELLVSSRLAELARQDEYVKIAQQVEAEQDSSLRDRTAEAVKVEVGVKVTDEIRREIRDAAAAERGGSYDELAPLDRAAVDAQVLLRMALPENIKRIADETEARMQSEEVQGIIDDRIQDTLKVKIGIKITEQHERIEHDVRTKVEEQMQLPENQALVDQYTDDLMKEAVAKALNNELINNVIMQQAEEGVKQLGDLLFNLTEYDRFYYGLRTYTGGVAAAAEGVELLYSNMPVLVSGVTQLRDGGKMLYDGLHQFDREGISQITNALDGQVGELRDRIAASFKAARDYRGLSCLGENDPCVSFVYRSGAID